MHASQLAELGRYFDEYMYGDRKLPGTQQAIFAFKACARELYSAESSQLKETYTLERYIATILVPEVAADLNKRQAAHPVIVPDKVKPTS